MVPLLVSLLLAVPPLTDAQRALAEQTTDYAGFDEAGLYALLPNVLVWNAGDEFGAIVPDYAALYDHPAAHRGEVFLLEGKFAGRSRRVELSRAGPYGDAVTEWVIVTGETAVGDVAVIFFVDPQNELVKPATEQLVRTVGRFYKVWSDLDAHGNPTDYLLFIARHPTLAGPSGGGGLSQSQAMLTAMLVLILLGAPLLILLRRAVVKPIAPRRLPRRDTQQTADQLESHLPVDPADALAQLERQHTDQP